MTLEEGAERIIWMPWLRPPKSLGVRRILAWKQCRTTLRCDYTGNDMRRCDYAGNGLNFRSLRGQGYIWWSFGSYLTGVSQHQTTVVFWDNEPDHLHTPQPPSASSEEGMAGRFSDKEGASFTQLKVQLWRLEQGESRALEWIWTCGVSWNLSTNEDYSLSRWDQVSRDAFPEMEKSYSMDWV